MSEPESDAKWVISEANVVEQAQRDKQLATGPPTPAALAALDRILDAEDAVEAAAARAVPGYESKKTRIAAEYDAYVRESWRRENPIAARAEDEKAKGSK